MPFPNEHSCRLLSPDGFVKFRRDNSKNPNIIIGFRRGGGSAAQALRYPTDKWTVADARRHCRSKKGSFTAASGDNKMDTMTGLRKRLYGPATGPFGFPMTDSAAKAADAALKEQDADARSACYAEIDGNRVDGYGRAYYDVKSRQLVEGERSDISLVTSASLDRDRDIMDPNGANWSTFQHNPVVTFAHDYHQLPIGKSLWVKRQTSEDVDRDGWLAKTRYTSKPKGWGGDWFPDAVWHMVQSGDMPGKSIGFVPIHIRPVKQSDVEQRQDSSNARAIISKYLVTEYSVAPVQSNPSAVVQAITKCLDNGLHIPAQVLESLGVILPAKTLDISAEEMEAAQIEYLPKIAGARTAQQAIDEIASERHKLLTRENVASMIRRELDRLRGRV